MSKLEPRLLRLIVNLTVYGFGLQALLAVLLAQIKMCDIVITKFKCGRCVKNAYL